MKVYARIKKFAITTSTSGDGDKKREVVFNIEQQVALPEFKRYLMDLDDQKDVIVELDVTAVSKEQYNLLK